MKKGEGEEKASAKNETGKETKKVDKKEDAGKEALGKSEDERNIDEVAKNEGEGDLGEDVSRKKELDFISPPCVSKNENKDETKRKRNFFARKKGKISQTRSVKKSIVT